MDQRTPTKTLEWIFWMGVHRFRLMAQTRTRCNVTWWYSFSLKLSVLVLWWTGRGRRSNENLWWFGGSIKRNHHILLTWKERNWNLRLEIWTHQWSKLSFFKADPRRKSCVWRVQVNSSWCTSSITPRDFLLSWQRSLRGWSLRWYVRDSSMARCVDRLDDQIHQSK